MALTAEKLREEYHYDPDSGLFSRPRIVGSRGRVKGGQIVGWLNDQGYVIIVIDGFKYRAHRLACLYMTGKWPEAEIDHIDLNKSFNAWSNLREASHASNMKNVKVRKHSKIGLKGVQLHNLTGTYRARITKNGKCHSLGLYATPELAHEAYIKASELLHGEFGRPQ